MVRRKNRHNLVAGFLRQEHRSQSDCGRGIAALGFQPHRNIGPTLSEKIQIDNIRLAGIADYSQAIQGYEGHETLNGGLEEGIRAQEPQHLLGILGTA
jgi:hypothetical protein